MFPDLSKCAISRPPPPPSPPWPPHILFSPLSIAPTPPCAGYLPCCGRSKRCAPSPKFPTTAAFPINPVYSQVCCACKCVDFAFRISWLQIATQLLPQLQILTNIPACCHPLVLVQRFTAATQRSFNRAPVASLPTHHAHNRICHLVFSQAVKLLHLLIFRLCAINCTLHESSQKAETGQGQRTKGPFEAKNQVTKKILPAQAFISTPQYRGS